MKKVIEVIDDVTAASFDTWLFHPTLPFIIEFYHEGEIIYGSHSAGQLIDGVRRFTYGWCSDELRT